MESPVTEPKVQPHSLITEDHVKRALHQDKGKEALLKSWSTVDFTKRGDNYACVVTSVEIKYIKNGVEHDVSYVVKLNPCAKVQDYPDLTPFLFSKEGRFYKEIVPVLDEVLTAAGQEPLRVPKCFFVLLENGKEQLYLEDLRTRGFRMFDRKKGMDIDHATLVLAELARMHGASYVLQKRLKEGESLSAKFDFLSKEYDIYTDEIKDLLASFMTSEVDTSIMMLEKIGGYETTIEWMKRFREEAGDVYLNGSESKRFAAICHGDCWNNNILFRYDTDGRPVETMLIDLQMCSETSVAHDLNYFLYASLTGDVRRPNIDHFISFYHSSYKGVLEGSNVPMYFDEDELMKEFREKNKLGLLLALGVIPVLLMEPEEAPETMDMDFEKLIEDFRKITLSKLNTHPLCKPRFLSIFDEFVDSGLIT